MISEQELLLKIKKGVEECKTTHYVIVDSSECEEYSEEVSDEILNDHHLAWLEPQRGVYIINTHYLTHFKKKFDNINKLFKTMTDCGYVIDSKRFGPVQINNRFNFEDKQEIHIGVVTMFSNKFFPSWKKFIKEMIIPNGVTVDIVIGDNSGKNLSQNLLKELLEECGGKYFNYYYTDLGECYQIRSDEHYLEIDKHSHVAVKYSQLLKEPANHYDYLLKIEDDVEPPADGFIRLYNHMKDFEKKKRKVACVAGFYPQKMDPSTACISMQPEIWGKIPKIKDMQPRLIRVEMQGGGFALYNCKAMQEVLPYRLTFKTPHNNYYMTGWDGSIGEYWSNNGWEQYVDGSLYCEHHF